MIIIIVTVNLLQQEQSEGKREMRFLASKKENDDYGNDNDRRSFGSNADCKFTSSSTDIEILIIEIPRAPFVNDYEHFLEEEKNKNKFEILVTFVVFDLYIYIYNPVRN
ncbi:unnamed protein product [Cunninghamella blakesleeana]